MCSPNILFPVFMFAFLFHCCSFSPCWLLAFLIFSVPLWISMFFFPRNSSPLFSITRSSSFLLVSTSKMTSKKTWLLFFSFQKPGQPCDFLPNKTFSCIWVARPVDGVILHWYACGADRQSGGQSVGVRSCDYQIFLDGKITTFP